MRERIINASALKKPNLKN